MAITFPATRLTAEVSLALGADLAADPATWAWTDITTYLRYEPGIEITVGQRDESSKSQPAQCTLTLDNTSGRFTPRNVAGAYYPSVRLNCPLRVRVNAGDGLVTRFVGFVDEWPLAWNQSADERHVEVTASGVLRRLQQGRTLRSALYREILSTSSLVAYWPLEGGSQASQAASPVPNVESMWGSLELGGDDGPGGSDPSLPSLASRGELFARIPHNGAAQHRIECVAKLGLEGQGAGDGPPVLQWSTPGTISLWRIEATDTEFQVTYYVGASGTTILVSGAPAFDGAWHHLRVDIEDNGANIDTTFVVDGVEVDATTIVGAAYNWPLDVGVLTFDTVEDQALPLGIGHIAVWSSVAATNTPDAATGWNAEQAGDRIVRVSAEEGVTATATAATGTEMGPQPVEALVGILEDVAGTDLGVMSDALGGVTYRAREERYNLTATMALDHSTRDLQHPLEVTDDDQRIRNDVVASQRNGTSARVVQTAGALGTAAIGTYDDTIDVNVADQSQLYAHAGWLVNLGTVDELRFPVVGLNFARSPALITTWLTLALGDRLTIANPPSELPTGTIDLQVIGYTEFIGRANWAATLNTVPNRPYNVIELDATGNGSRFDTDGSTLSGAHNSTTTSFSVATASGTLWATSGAVPFDAEVAGEQVTVTAVSGGSSPQTFTVTRSVNGVVKAQSSGAAISLRRPYVLAL